VEEEAACTKVVIINFHLEDKPSLDVDNMSKPILDVLEGIVYDNDHQVTQAEITHVRIDAPLRVRRGLPDTRVRGASGESVRVRADRRPGGTIPTPEVMPWILNEN
jgi:hypothetical protein